MKNKTDNMDAIEAVITQIKESPHRKVFYGDGTHRTFTLGQWESFGSSVEEMRVVRIEDMQGNVLLNNMAEPVAKLWTFRRFAMIVAAVLSILLAMVLLFSCCRHAHPRMNYPEGIHCKPFPYNHACNETRRR